MNTVDDAGGYPPSQMSNSFKPTTSGSLLPLKLALKTPVSEHLEGETMCFSSLLAINTNMSFKGIYISALNICMKNRHLEGLTALRTQ